MESKLINKNIKAIKESDNKFTDNMRFMIVSLLKSVNKISEIDIKISLTDNKELNNKFTDNMRFMIYSLLKSLNKISEIDKKISLIDNKFTDNMRFMIDSLLKPVNKISESNKKMTQIDDNAICIINIKEKNKSKWVNKNILTKLFIEKEKELIDNNNWIQKNTVKIFWNNNTVSEIREKWILYCNTNYAYIRSEELHTFR